MKLTNITLVASNVQRPRLKAIAQEIAEFMTSAIAADKHPRIYFVAIPDEFTKIAKGIDPEMFYLIEVRESTRAGSNLLGYI